MFHLRKIGRNEKTKISSNIYIHKKEMKKNDNNDNTSSMTTTTDNNVCDKIKIKNKNNDKNC